MNIKKRTFLEEFVHNKARRFWPLTLPDDIERGKVGDCFDHCMIQAVKSNGKYFYCEGVAFINGEWIHHAWLTDAGGRQAYDPTWRAIDKETGKEIPMVMAHYLGAVLNLNLLIEFVVKTEYKSPLANHEKNPEIAQKIYDTAS